MQGARPNVGKVSTPLGGKQATRLGSSPQPQPATFKPCEYGARDLPNSGPKPVPRPSTARPQAVVADATRSGSRVVASVNSAGLVEAGKVTGTPAEPVMQQAPALNNAESV